ncbi:GNAT family N-acetyltransferase [Brevibacterium sp. 91QC2O2]|uniref:GNAT family N-acetyltransferase n=1 Tax=Brevibacterium TaxID=1696 RepID=UPI00211C94A4|nr:MULTISPECIES: GNAT family protein [unclassified Brevibacterium]MCQ9366778.1 GNAT family N-acetyltransferase [Brevibacterium sp. 91QC2O2]MCQ9384250.1 GNAT family N-acetyltransferase [Brevibacterium sp. 68QC2CO]
MKPSFLPLRTERLILRVHRTDDADALRIVYCRPEVARFLLDEPWTPQDAIVKTAERVPKTDLDGETGALALVIEHAGRLVGDVQLWFTDREHRVCEIGWVLDTDFGGQGLATEAVAAVLDLAFEHFRVHRVTAQMDGRNTASAKLARNLGMEHEAHLRQDWWSKGEWTDTLIYGILAGDSRHRTTGLPQD